MPPQMLYISDNVPLMVCHVAKFHEITPFNLKVMSANTLNYKPILDPLKKLLGEPPSPAGYRLAKRTFYTVSQKHPRHFRL